MSQTAWLQIRLDKLKLQYEKTEDALAMLNDVTISAYTFDDGQTTQRVTRESLPEWITKQENLLNQIMVLDNQLTGEGTQRAAGAW